jgi:hypothetical protein
MHPHPSPLPGREREQCWSGSGRLGGDVIFADQGGEAVILQRERGVNLVVVDA